MLRKYLNLVTSSTHRSGSVIPLKLFVLLFVVIGQVNATTLSKTDIPGLTLDSSRVKVLKADPKIASLFALNRVLQKYEHWVETENKKIKALLSISTTDHSLALTVYNNAGLVIGQFTPKSQFIVIPASKDQIWIAGKESGEGYLHLDGKIRYRGLYSYSPSGESLATVSKEITGGITAMKATADGGVVALTAVGLLAIDTTGSIFWRRNDSSHKIISSQKGDLFGTESWDRNADSRTITLYGLEGDILYSATDSTDSRVSITSISKNSKYIAVQRFVSSAPLRWNIVILEITDSRTILVSHSMTINGGPMQVEISNNAEIFGFVVNERVKTGFVRKASSLDKLGNKLFEYVPSESDRQSMNILMENGNLKIKKRSGDIKLEIVSPAP